MPVTPPQPPDADDVTNLRSTVTNALRRYGTESSRLAHTFAARHGLQPTDLQALVTITSAEGHEQAVTPGQLRNHLGLSSAGTSYVIDRLEDAGHIKRTRGNSVDGRLVHLVPTEHGIATAMAFFGPLSNVAEDRMNQLTVSELTAVAQFLEAIVTTTENHVAALAAGALPGR